MKMSFAVRWTPPVAAKTHVNPFLRVGNGDDGRVIDGFQCDFHRVAVITFQRQRVAGDDVVLNNEMHQRLLIVVAVSDGATDLWALQALPAKWDCTNFLPRLDIVNRRKSLSKS